MRTLFSGQKDNRSIFGIFAREHENDSAVLIKFPTARRVIINTNTCSLDRTKFAGRSLGKVEKHCVRASAPLNRWPPSSAKRQPIRRRPATSSRTLKDTVLCVTVEQPPVQRWETIEKASAARNSIISNQPLREFKLNWCKNQTVLRILKGHIFLVELSNQMHDVDGRKDLIREPWRTGMDKDWTHYTKRVDVPEHHQIFIYSSDLTTSCRYKRSQWCRRTTRHFFWQIGVFSDI
jgi:hypothetical protein